MALNRQQRRNAQTIFTLGRQAGLPPNRAKELVAAAYAESGLNPRATNKSSGAAGLFQLLSSGYVKQANRRGGVYNPVANTKAILSDYVNYWKRHPGAAPGEAGRDVELSGEGAGFYSSPLAKIGDLGVPAPATRPRPQRPFGGIPGGVSIPGFSMPGLNVPSVQLPKGLGVSFNQSMKTLGLPNVDFGGFNLPPIKIPGIQVTKPSGIRRPLGNVGGIPVIADTKGALPPKTRTVLSQARKYLGTPYVWGGSNPKGFDCSGFVQYLWAKQGVKIPRTTYDQFKTGTPIKRNQLQPGDSVFFHMGPRGPEHMGLYLGNGKFIQAPHTGDVVKISNLNDPYYRKAFAGARRNK